MYHVSYQRPLFLLTDITEQVRLDVQTKIGYVVKMLAGNEPDNFADLSLGIKMRHTVKGFQVNLLRAELLVSAQGSPGNAWTMPGEPNLLAISGD